MASLSDAQKKKLQLQQEIARLSGAIARHGTSAGGGQPAYHPYKSSRPTAGAGGGSRARANTTRGRGRGRGAYSLDLRAQNKSRPPPTTAPAPGTSASRKEEGEVEDSVMEAPPPPPASTVGWVRTGRTGNKSLMTVEKRAQLVNAKSSSALASSAKRPPKVKRAKIFVQALPSLVPNGTPRITINGLSYDFLPGGKGLKRVSDYQNPNPLEWFVNNGKVVKVLDIKYKFQENGDLSPLSSAKTRLCRSFTKTGRCHKAHICKSIHDPNRVAICSLFLNGRCELGTSCPLSHSSSAHNTPYCARFQAYSYCTRPDCPYPHIKVSDDAPICEDFAFSGWCDKEEGTCTDLHSWDCPEFWSTGKCPRKDKCKFRHTLRAEKGRVLVEPKVKQERKGGDSSNATAGFEEQTEFIEFDQGSPGLPLSEEEDDKEEDDDESEEEESEEEEGDDDESDGHGKQEAFADHSDQPLERIIF